MNTLFIIFGTNAYHKILSNGGINQSQIQNATIILKEILATNMGSVATKYSVPVARLEGLIGDYRHAYDIGLTEVLIVASAVFLICAALTWVFIPKIEYAPDF